jgi:2Fe-2S type ferredoxin
MAVVNLVDVGLGVLLTLLVLAVHFSRGTGWESSPDVSQEVLERRAESVPETDFPEPMNRSIGGGGVAAAAVGAGEEGAELEGEEAATEAESGPWDVPDDEAEQFEIEFVKEGETVELVENKPILDQGEDQGFDLPYACRQGQCVSCSAHIPDGPAGDFVVHNDQEMFTEDEMGEGYTLTCVAYPKADFSIETGEAP